MRGKPRTGLTRAVEISFDDLASVPAGPGVYEVWTRSGKALKVGIAANLRRRLRAHAASLQSGLRVKPGGTRKDPSNVESKKSILAKHLYYDSGITQEFDLTTEVGRQAFLGERCLVRYRTEATRDDARAVERGLESIGDYRYRGRVVLRHDQ